MKILIDAHLSENKLTGIGRYLNRLIRALLELDKTNEYFILVQKGITSDHPLNQLKAHHLTKIPIRIKGSSLRQHVVIPKILLRLKPDIYHHPHFDLPLFHKIPSVVTIHDLKYIRNPHFFPEFSGIKRWYMKQMLLNSITQAQKVITVSESTKNDLIDLFHISAKKVAVVYHGLEKKLQKELDQRQMTKVLREYGIFDNFILFVGERRPHKNIVNLIKAFILVKKKLQHNIQLVILGKAYSSYDEPEKIIKSENLGKNVIITDFVTDEELGIFYRNAVMLALPSLYEGFGLPIIEAMSCGTPVLGSKLTSLPEIIEDAGILINPLDISDIATKIINVLQNDELRTTLIKRGLNQAKKFNWEDTARKTLEVYKSVIDTTC